MGTICAHPHDSKEQCNQTADTNKRNFVQLQGTLGHHAHVELVLGHYRQQRAQSLFVILENKFITLCDPIKEYSQDCSKTVQTIQNLRKTYFKPALHKNCPYKKVLLCILPNYRSEDRQQYRQLFLNVVREALDDVKEMAVEFNHTVDGINNLPNQMLMGLLLGEVAERRTGFRLSLVTTQKKMMSFYRYQLMKTEKFHTTG